MKPEQQRVAIAEECGIKCERCGGTGILRKMGAEEYAAMRAFHKGWMQQWPEKEPDLPCIHESLPDYLNDLNAILCEIRKRETDGGFAYHYCENLKGTILLRAGLKYPGLVGEFRIATAEADVHAEAFLRTLGKWKELL